MKVFLSVALAALVGGLIGAGLAFVNTAGFLMPWVPLPAPPQAAVQLLAAASPYLLMMDGSGRLFVYQRAADAWTEIDAGQAAAYPNQAIAGPANPFMPHPPGGALEVAYVLDAGQAVPAGPEVSAGQSSAEYGGYALGQDGTLWDWFKTDSPAERRAGLLLPAAGAAIGLGLSLLLLYLRRL